MKLLSLYSYQQQIFTDGNASANSLFIFLHIDMLSHENTRNTIKDEIRVRLYELATIWKLFAESSYIGAWKMIAMYKEARMNNAYKKKETKEKR